MKMHAVVAFLLTSLGHAAVLDAQTRSRSYIEVSLGGSRLLGHVPSNGAVYERRSGYGLLAIGHQADVNRSLIAALNVGLLGVPSGSTDCRLTPLGGCLQEYPLLGIVGLTIGGRPFDSPWRFVELTAGPAFIMPGNGDGGTVGMLAVGRIGVPPGFYLSPGLTFHGIVTPIDRTVMFVAGVGVSLRTW